MFSPLCADFDGDSLTNGAVLRGEKKRRKIVQRNSLLLALVVGKGSKAVYGAQMMVILGTISDSGPIDRMN